MTDRLWSVGETARHLAVSERFVRRHAVELGGLKVGGLLRFRLAEVEAYLEGRRLDGRALRRAEPRRTGVRRGTIGGGPKGLRAS